MHTLEIIKTDQDSKKPSRDQPAKATSLHISLCPPPAREQLNKPKTVPGSCAKSKLLPLLLMGTISKRIWCLWSTVMLKHGKEKEIKRQDTKQRVNGGRRGRKKIGIEQQAFLEGIAWILQVHTAEENNFHCYLLKISKFFKYNMNRIIQRTSLKAEQDPYGCSEDNMHMAKLKLYLFCYATQQVNVPTQFYLRRKNTFLVFTWQSHSFQVLSNIRQGPQTAEIHNS